MRDVESLVNVCNGFACLGEPVAGERLWNGSILGEVASDVAAIRELHKDVDLAVGTNAARSK